MKGRIFTPEEEALLRKVGVMVTVQPGGVVYLCSVTMDYLVERMEEQCLLDRYGKVASYILNRTVPDSEDMGTEGGVLPYTHEDLSVSLGLNRSTVTQVL